MYTKIALLEMVREAREIKKAKGCPKIQVISNLILGSPLYLKVIRLETG